MKIKGLTMKKYRKLALGIVIMVMCIAVSGCVDRKLTIKTEPAGAVVLLNDEEIGESPVTVSFNWYGDYNVTLSKEGYETLKTHRKLGAPWYDYFPFDFFVNNLNPKRIVDSYEWTFRLEEKKYPPREELISSAEKLKKEASVITPDARKK
jgi:hypothetical protein